MKVLLLILAAAATATTVDAQACTSGFKAASDCNKYYACSGGQWVIQSCPAGLNWNAAGNYCDWPASAGCTSGSVAPAPAPTTSAPTPATGTDSGSTSGSALITQAEFNSAAATKGGSPSNSYYTGFINSLSKAGITTRKEAALFLAHAVWETVGFKYTKEVYCQTNLEACRQAYPSNSGGLSDKVYYGRGMLQLTWDYNYKACSTYLYNDDRLIQNPEQVADDPAVGWATAACYWQRAVHPIATTFGNTLKAINGALECDGGSHAENRVLRFNHYKDILRILGMPIPADSDGYCHA